MEPIILNPRSARHERYASADLTRAIVRRAQSDDDWRLVAQLRKDGFTRVRGVAADGPWLDELDRSQAAFSLLGFALDGTPLATMRVQDGRSGPLELRRFVDPEVVLEAAERPASQFGRLSVLRSVENTHVMFGVFQCAWHWCFREGIKTIVIASPSWSKSIYDFMHFQSAGETGRFLHHFAGDAPHETMKLPVQTAEPLWRDHGHPLSDQFFCKQYPQIQA